MTLRQLLRDGGRRYAVVVLVLRYGSALSALGLLVSVAVPAIAIHVAEILGSFGLLGSAAIVSYQGANAAKDWRHPTGAERGTEAPPARQSGMVTEPGGGQ